MWMPCTKDNITSIANQISISAKEERLKLIADIENPGLLEFIAIEVLERAKENRLNPFEAMALDDELTERIDRLRGFSPKRYYRKR